MLNRVYELETAIHRSQIRVQTLSGEGCGEILRRLERALELLGKGEEIPPFFRNPAGFLAAAARHNQLEQATQARQQVLDLEKFLKRYL